jgi:serine/threonine protein phosphatase PrpC
MALPIPISFTDYPFIAWENYRSQPSEKAMTRPDALFFFELGKEHLQRQDYAKAVNAFAKFVTQCPLRQEFHFRFQEALELTVFSFLNDPAEKPFSLKTTKLSEQFFKIVRYYRDNRCLSEADYETENYSTKLRTLPTLTKERLIYADLNYLSPTFKLDSETLCAKTPPYPCAVLSKQGDRESNEDRYLIGRFQIKQNDRTPVRAYIWGVFDGHNGFACAEFLKLNMINTLELEFNAKESLDDRNVFNALKIGFVNLQKKWLSAPHDCSGSTACVCLIINERLFIANVGDSRAVLASNKRAYQLSNDQKSDVSYYSTYKRGGFLARGLDFNGFRTGGMLDMSRAFGDDGMVNGLNVRPEIKIFDLENLAKNKSVTLLIGCDGIWDVINSEEAAAAVHEVPYLAVPSLLVRGALRRNTFDNATLIAVEICPAKAPPKRQTPKTPKLLSRSL